MSKSRKARVPAKLHSELTEYASLLRVLRANHTYDLSTQLANLSQSNSQLSDSASEDDYDIHENDHINEGHDTGKGKSTATKGKIGSLQHRSSKRSRLSEGWTRWPLLTGDVSHPEWGLRDELSYIVAQNRRKATSLEGKNSTLEESSTPINRSSPHESIVSFSRRDQNSLDEEKEDNHSSSSSFVNSHDDSEGSFHNANSGDETDILSSISDSELGDDTPSNVALTDSTIHQLRILLSSCAAFLPSEHVKAKPHSWASVLQVAKTMKTIPPEILERVEKRLLALYGDATSQEEIDANSSECTHEALTNNPRDSVSETRRVSVTPTSPASANSQQADLSQGDHKRDNDQSQCSERVRTDNTKNPEVSKSRVGRKRKQRDAEIAIKERIKLLADRDPFVKKIVDEYDSNEALMKAQGSLTTEEDLTRFPRWMSPSIRSLVDEVTGKSPRLYTSSSIPLSHCQARRNALTVECVRDGSWDTLGDVFVYDEPKPRKRKKNMKKETTTERNHVDSNR